jgi:hypothetical protein
MLLERSTYPKHSRRTCSPRYGLLSCRGKSAGVANVRVSDLPILMFTMFTIRNCFRRCIAASEGAPSEFVLPPLVASGMAVRVSGSG